MYGRLARERLPASDDGINVFGVEFQAIAGSAHTLGCDKRRSAAGEWIENDVSTRGAINDCVSNHGYRLNRRMQGEKVSFVGRTGKRVGTRVLPDVAATTAELPELHVIAMRTLALLKNENQLMLAAIEGAHAGVVLGPYAKVLQLLIDPAAGCEQLRHMPPVHTNEVNGSLLAA